MRVGNLVQNKHTFKVYTIVKIERVQRAPGDYIMVYELGDGSRYDSITFDSHFKLYYS